ncbi:hypothetical protein [Rhodocaloribacter sp.]
MQERKDFVKWLKTVDADRIKAVDESDVVQTRMIDHSLMRPAFGYAPRIRQAPDFVEQIKARGARGLFRTTTRTLIPFR